MVNCLSVGLTLVLVLVLDCRLTVADARVCDTPQWVYFRDSRYYFGKVPKTWFQAQETCRQLGGNLVTVDDADENNFLFNNMLLPENYRFFSIRADRVNVASKWPYPTSFSASITWIGYNDLNTEGKFEWVDPLGARTTYTNWYKGEPNNANVQGISCGSTCENCASMWLVFLNDYSMRSWYDVRCDLLGTFVCEAKIPNNDLSENQSCCCCNDKDNDNDKDNNKNNDKDKDNNKDDGKKDDKDKDNNKDGDKDKNKGKDN